MQPPPQRKRIRAYAIQRSARILPALAMASRPRTPPLEEALRTGVSQARAVKRMQPHGPSRVWAT